MSAAAVTPEALAWVRQTADSTADARERSLVLGVIESVTEGRRLPSWRTMTPLMQAVALALQGKTRPWEDAGPELDDDYLAVRTERRAADRAVMCKQVSQLAARHGITARAFSGHTPRSVGVDLEGPHGLKLTVRFDGTRMKDHVDRYVLSWHGVEDGWRLNQREFADVNPYHGHKATDFARGSASLMVLLDARFWAIEAGVAFVRTLAVAEVVDYGTNTRTFCCLPDGRDWRELWVGPRDWRGQPQCPLTRDGLPFGSHPRDWPDGQRPEGVLLYGEAEL